MIHYFYRIAQTDETVFVTCEPSIDLDGDARLVLSGTQETV